MKSHFIGHRKRLKDRFRSAPDIIPDYELLELMLGYVIRGRDVKDEAKNLLKYVEGNFNNIYLKNIKDIYGLGPEVELFFDVIREFHRRQALHNHNSKDIIRSPKDVYEFIKYSIGYQDRESFMVLLINNAGNVISNQVLFDGTVNCSQVHIREVVEYALKNKAVGVIIAHNHPSGKLEASREDIDITNRIKKALELVEINLLDHVVVTP